MRKAVQSSTILGREPLGKIRLDEQASVAYAVRVCHSSKSVRLRVLACKVISRCYRPVFSRGVLPPWSWVRTLARLRALRPNLRTPRHVTYTEDVDWIPPCQPGLNFPPHAFRLASPHAGSCGRQAVSVIGTSLTRYLRRTLAFSQKEHRGDST
jgi:hypothetical protein